MSLHFIFDPNFMQFADISKINLIDAVQIESVVNTIINADKLKISSEHTADEDKKSNSDENSTHSNILVDADKYTHPIDISSNDKACVMDQTGMEQVSIEYFPANEISLEDTCGDQQADQNCPQSISSITCEIQNGSLEWNACDHARQVQTSEVQNMKYVCSDTFLDDAEFLGKENCDNFSNKKSGNKNGNLLDYYALSAKPPDACCKRSVNSKDSQDSHGLHSTGIKGPLYSMKQMKLELMTIKRECADVNSVRSKLTLLDCGRCINRDESESVCNTYMGSSNKVLKALQVIPCVYVL